MRACRMRLARTVAVTPGRPVAAPATASTYAPIDDLSDGGPELVAVTARLHREIGHSFGYPELPQLTADGRFVWAYWDYTRRPHLKNWAEIHEVAIDGLPDDA